MLRGFKIQTIANAVYALAEEPEKYVDELRREITENCNADGTFNKANIGKLKKMDSFLREVGRLKNPGLRKSTPRIPLRKKISALTPSHHESQPRSQCQKRFSIQGWYGC